MSTWSVFLTGFGRGQGIQEVSRRLSCVNKTTRYHTAGQSRTHCLSSEVSMMNRVEQIEMIECGSSSVRGRQRKVAEMQGRGGSLLKAQRKDG